MERAETKAAEREARIAALAALVVGGMVMFGALGWVTGAARPQDLKSLYRGPEAD